MFFRVVIIIFRVRFLYPKAIQMASSWGQYWEVHLNWRHDSRGNQGALLFLMKSPSIWRRGIEKKIKSSHPIQSFIRCPICLPPRQYPLPSRYFNLISTIRDFPKNQTPYYTHTYVAVVSYQTKNHLSNLIERTTMIKTRHLENVARYLEEWKKLSQN